MIDIDQANRTAVERMMTARPILRRVAPAREVIPALNGRMLLHAGPPITWERAAGPLRGAMIGACLYEGWAQGADEAEALLQSGAVRWEPCHHHGAVGPMAGVTSPSMQVYVIENVTHGNFAYSNLNEGYGKVLRYGAYSPEVLAKLRWMNDVMGPLLAKALERSGDGLDIRALLAESLHMGDEGHNRNKAGSLLYTTKLAPWIVASAPDAQTAADVLKFLGDNALSVLNPVMAACKAMADAAHGVEGSTLMTTMARNGTDLGIRVSGLGDRWFTGPAGVPDGLYFPGFTAADANRDIGDSTITETAGIGAFAMAAAPAIVTFVSGTPQDAINATLEMYEITRGRAQRLHHPDAGLSRHANRCRHPARRRAWASRRASTRALPTARPAWVRSAPDLSAHRCRYLRTPCWPLPTGTWSSRAMMFLERLRQTCHEQPEKVALEFVDEHFAGTTTVTYGELERKVLKTMAMLQAKGITPGDRVALQLPKCLPFVYLYLAIMRLQAICLPLNTGYPPRELAYFLADAEARLLFGDERSRAAVEPLLQDLPALEECVYLDCADADPFREESALPEAA